jgi:segregation and condensation protein B
MFLNEYGDHLRSGVQGQDKGYYSMTEITESNIEFSLEASLEALLFVASGPVTLAQLAATVDKPLSTVEEALNELEESYSQLRGLSLQWHAGKVQLTTSPQMAPVVERFLGLEATSHLSRAALETLAIIAYQHQVTRPQLDNIRGVNSDGVVKSLLSKGLIQDIGRAEGPGRPIMYGVTSDFLQHFGLATIEELPPLNLEEDGTPAGVQNGELLKD